MRFQEQVNADNQTPFQENTFQINASSHAFKILSDSLYKNKELAVLRELSCNALDAHVAAGISDVPIKITLPCELDPILLVEDKGEGMSKTKLEKLYTTYFESTKRDSDDDIGGFGLGSKSPFAVTDNFTVTSTTPEGESTTILSYLDNGIPKVMVTSHDENSDLPQGTTVQVTFPENRVAAIMQVVFDGQNGLFDYWKTFPEIICSNFAEKAHLDGIEEAKQSNEFKTGATVLTRTDEGYVCIYPRQNSQDLHRNFQVVYGNIAYEIPENLFAKLNIEGKLFKESSFAVHIDLSTIIELSPSREYIEDCESNLIVIQKIISDVSDQIRKKLLHRLTKTFILFLRIYEKCPEEDLKGVDYYHHFLNKFDELHSITTTNSWRNPRAEALNGYFDLLNKHQGAMNMAHALQYAMNWFAAKIFGDAKEEYVYASAHHPLKNMDFSLFNNCRATIEPKSKTHHGLDSFTYFDDVKKVYIISNRMSLNYLSTVNDFEEHILENEPDSVCLRLRNDYRQGRFFRTFYPNLEICFVDKPYLNKRLGIKRNVTRVDASKIKIGTVYFLGGEYEITKANCHEIAGQEFFIVDKESSFTPYQAKEINFVYPTRFLVITAKAATRKTKYFNDFVEANTLLKAGPYDRGFTPAQAFKEQVMRDEKIQYAFHVLNFLRKTGVSTYEKFKYTDDYLRTFSRYAKNRDVRRFKESLDYAYTKLKGRYRAATAQLDDFVDIVSDETNYHLPHSLKTAYETIDYGRKLNNRYVNIETVFRDLHEHAKKAGVL